MTKPTITEADFTAAIEKAVADAGADYVYNPYHSRECRYLEEDLEPSCIVGTALVNLGFEPNPDWDNPFHPEAGVDEDDTAADTILPRFFEIPGNVVLAARKAQLEQDTGGTWGGALFAYKEAVAE